jgi:hypothetical protein
VGGSMGHGGRGWRGQAWRAVDRRTLHPPGGAWVVQGGERVVATRRGDTRQTRGDKTVSGDKTAPGDKTTLRSAPAVLAACVRRRSCGEPATQPGAEAAGGSHPGAPRQD